MADKPAKSTLTLKRRKFVAGLLAGKSQTKAAISAGYSKKCAKSIASEILTKPDVKATFAELLDKAGLTDDHLAARIKELSAAKETKFFQKDGIVTDQRDVEALGVQSDMVQFATKLKGHLVDRLDVTLDPISDALEKMGGKGGKS